MDARSRNLFAKVGWNLDDQRRLQVSANHYELQGNNDYRTVPGNIATGQLATSAPGGSEGEGARNRSTSVVLDYTDHDLAGGFLQTQLYWVDFKALYGGSYWGDFWGDGRDPDWYDQSQNASEKLGGKFSWSRGDLFGMDLRATFGLDLARDSTYQELVYAQIDWVPETTYESVSPFVQAEWRFADAWLLTGGLRHERGELRVDDYLTIPDQRTVPAGVKGTRYLVTGGTTKTTENPAEPGPGVGSHRRAQAVRVLRRRLHRGRHRSRAARHHRGRPAGGQPGRPAAGHRRQPGDRPGLRRRPLAGASGPVPLRLGPGLAPGLRYRDTDLCRGP